MLGAELNSPVPGEDDEEEEEKGKDFLSNTFLPCLSKEGVLKRTEGGLATAADLFLSAIGDLKPSFLSLIARRGDNKVGILIKPFGDTSCARALVIINQQEDF